jgi:hypothetical protein
MTSVRSLVNRSFSMADGRANNGGRRPGSGRKSKAEEAGLQALLTECWSESDRKACIRELAKKAKAGQMAAIELLLAYAYGKPKEPKVHSGELTVKSVSEMTDAELLHIAASGSG